MAVNIQGQISMYPKYHVRCAVYIIVNLTSFERSIGYFHVTLEETPGELSHSLRTSE